MKPRYLFALLCTGYFGCAQAEIYKYTDADGHVTYSSVPMKGAKKLDLEPLPVTSAPPPARAARSEGRSESPADFPKVDSNTQKGRDNTRRKILDDEMAAEEKLLAAARQNLKEGKENPEVFRGKDGKTYRNAAKFEEKISALEDEVTLHEKNIQALKSELANLK